MAYKPLPQFPDNLGEQRRREFLEKGDIDSYINWLTGFIGRWTSKGYDTSKYNGYLEDARRERHARTASPI